MAPTLKDIALRSGFSVPTVSCVLNDKAHLFKPETRDRILDTARSMGYRPNGLARALSGARTQLVGLIGGDPYRTGETGHIATSRVLSGVDEQLWASGYRLQVAFCRREQERFEQHLKDFSMYRVDGVLLNQPLFWKGWAWTEQLAALLPVELPLVMIGEHPVAAPRVSVDRASGMEALVDHAWALGHRRFAFMFSRLISNQDKFDGLVRGLEKYGLSEAHLHRVEQVHDFQAAGDRAGEILALAPRPTFVFCSNDVLALGLIQGLNRQGVSVPAQLSVAGFDDLPEAATAQTPLTTVQQPYEEVGRRATDLLLSLIADQVAWPEAADRQEVVAPVLVPRHSTGPAA